jgi:hypothetical protein
VTKKWPIRIYGKTGPTKSTVLGARPPPVNFNKFYRFFTIFAFLGPSIQPGKPSPKSASTANPPSKVVKKWFFKKIIVFYRFNRFINTAQAIYRDPISTLYHFLFKIYLIQWVVINLKLLYQMIQSNQFQNILSIDSIANKDISKRFKSKQSNKTESQCLPFLNVVFCFLCGDLRNN